MWILNLEKNIIVFLKYFHFRIFSFKKEIKYDNMYYKKLLEDKYEKSNSFFGIYS